MAFGFKLKCRQTCPESDPNETSACFAASIRQCEFGSYPTCFFFESTLTPFRLFAQTLREKLPWESSRGPARRNQSTERDAATATTSGPEPAEYTMCLKKINPGILYVGTKYERIKNAAIIDLSIHHVCADRRPVLTGFSQLRLMIVFVIDAVHECRRLTSRRCLAPFQLSASRRN